ncbi:MAG: helix-turn-helix domain-containing protein [Cellulomonas sp.]|nr:helix-turn-helix domain-containing protein [Cellulomonas sp.]
MDDPRLDDAVIGDAVVTRDLHPVATVSSVGWISPGEVGLDAQVYVEETRYSTGDDDPAMVTVEGGVESIGATNSLHLSADAAREPGCALLAAADVLDGPPESGRRVQGRTGETQYKAVQAIRRRIAALPIGQSEVAVAAGYSPTEPSLFLTGQRTVDLTDVELIAKALGVNPFALMNEATE